MPEKKRNYFKINGLRARWRKRKNGVFEIRCMVNGKNYYGSSIDLKIAKKRFLENLQADETPTEAIAPKQIPTFEDYAYHYLTTFKKKNICEKAFRNYCGIVKRHIAPPFAGKLISEVTATECQKITNVLDDAEKYRTLEDVVNLLKWICEAAVGDGYLKISPMNTVDVLKYARNKGTSLPLDLVREKLLTVPVCKYDYLILFSLFSGVRPCELNNVIFDDDYFIQVKNGKKRKNEPETWRRIPLHSYLHPYFSELKELVPKLRADEVAKHFRKKGLTGYKFRDLRHTFTTYVQEGGARKEWVDYATNHVSAQNVTDRVYTHWSDEFQRAQMEMLSFSPKLVPKTF